MSLALNITGVRTLNGSGFDLIRCVREERAVGAERALNKGAVALADWLVNTDMIGAAVGIYNFLTFNGSETIRYLTGEIEPTEDVANYLAEGTGGAVLPAMFARPVEMPDVMPTRTVAASGRAVDPSSPGGRPPEIIRITEDMVLDKSGSDGLFIRTPGWVVRIDPRVIAALHSGLGRMLGKAA